MEFYLFERQKNPQFQYCVQCFIEHHKLFKFSNKISLSVLEIKNSLKFHSIRTTYINNAYRISLKGNHGLHGFQLYLIFLTVLLFT